MNVIDPGSKRKELISAVQSTEAMLEKPGWGQILPAEGFCPGRLALYKCHNEPLWHSLGKWSRCSFPFLGYCGALGAPDRVKRRFGLKSSILFCSSLDVVSMRQEQTAPFVDCTMKISLGHSENGLEKLESDIKQQKVRINVQKLYNVSGSNCLSFCIVL